MDGRGVVGRLGRSRTHGSKGEVSGHEGNVTWRTVGAGRSGVRGANYILAI